MPGVSESISISQSSFSVWWVKYRFLEMIAKQSNALDVKNIPSPEWFCGSVVSLPLASSRIDSRASYRPVNR